MYNIFRRLKYIAYSFVALFLGLFIKRDEKRIAFGSWCGELYADNSKYLLEYLLASGYLEKGYRLYWVANARFEKKTKLPAGVTVIHMNTLNAMIPLLKCKYMIFSLAPEGDISQFNVFNGATMVFLDHGVGVKRWAMDAIDYDGRLEKKNIPLLKRIANSITGNGVYFDWFVSSSDFHFDTYLTSNKYRNAHSGNILRSGTPRNDILVNCTDEQINEFKSKYAQMLGFDKNCKVVMYLPTFRRKTSKVESLIERSQSEVDALNSVLEKYNAVLVEKNHFVNGQSECDATPQARKNRLIKLTQPVDLQEMLTFTDVQISDYSGSFIDYLHVDKPIIFYTYDYEEYKNVDSGLYMDIDDYAAGPVVTDFDGVCRELECALNGEDNYQSRRAEMKELFLGYENGMACSRITEELFG